MSPMILSSSIFFLMVVAAFILSFQIIFKQKKLSDMKTDFINNMTHELKTPIATISIASEMLKDNSISQSKDNREKYASIIFDENKRLYNHVEQVLQIARLEKGELQLI
jgi:two-component system phosphate regulon sensor histidine kinase PhoR